MTIIKNLKFDLTEWLVVKRDNIHTRRYEKLNRSADELAAEIDAIIAGLRASNQNNPPRL